MADTRFTALGMSGSGKTCYVLGMYYEMSVGIRGFNLVTNNNTAYKLEAWMDKLDEETGADRFPAGTGLTEVTDYGFMLKYCNRDVFSFDWMDYGGGTLKEKENNPEAFNSLNQSIEESTALYIFIDGDLLMEETREKRKRNVQRKIARIVNPFISEFDDGSRYMPPIVFVVTKMDECARFLENGELAEIIQESFSPVFGADKRVYIVPVSLGKEISDDDYSGDVEPVNIHIPFFLGIYHEFFNHCVCVKEEIDKKKNENEESISNSQGLIDYENSRWIFRPKQDVIEDCRKKIEEANENIRNLDDILDKYKELLGEVAAELDRQNANFETYINGQKTEFSHKETYTF